MSFKYDVGQAVEYKPVGGKTGFFTVVRRMPEEHGAFDRRYRIKSGRESFERNVLECDLNATDLPESMYGEVVPVRRTGGHR
jgi:hypothetical protein